MASEFFSQNWYRVATLRPRILGHVRVERHRYGGQPWYALHDPLAGRVHRVTVSAYLFVARMDGRRTVDQIWQGLVAELDSDAPGQEQVVQLLMQLHGADLLQSDMTPDAAELLARRDQLSRALWVRNLRSPMSIQLPLIDPDRFLTATLPIVRPLLGTVGLLLWLALVIAGLVAAGQHWAELSGDIVDRVMAGEGVLAMALCYPVIKAMHELGHGYVAKRFGCEVREMGVMLLVLFPVPYVDVSGSAALRSKWARAAVAGAGIAVELALAAVAALVWVSAEPGLLRAVAFNVMVIGGVSTLAVNGNPLLRFDGYYVMMDVLDVPNLAQRATRYLGHLVDRFVFGMPGLQAFAASRFERLTMLVYGPAAWAYRMTVLLGVSLFIAANYFVLGVAAAIVSVVLAFVWPLTKALWKVATAPHYRPRRLRASATTFGAIAAAAVLVATVPAPLHTNAEGVVWLPDASIVRAGADGFVRSVGQPAGAAVDTGDLLFTLEHPVNDARRRVQEAKVEELTYKLAGEWVTDRVTAEATRFELSQEQASLDRETVRAQRRGVVAAQPGTFGAVRPAPDMIGRYVKEGEVVGYVTPAFGRLVRAVVPQADIGLLRSRLAAVTLRLNDRTTDLSSRVVRAVPAGQDDLPSPALLRSNGGQVTADPRDQTGRRAFERYFQFDLALPDGATPDFGARVHVRFDYDWEPLGQIVYRRVRQVMLDRFGA